MNIDELYLDLIKKSLTDTIVKNDTYYFKKELPIINQLNYFFEKFSYCLCKARKLTFNTHTLEGNLHSPKAVSLLGYKRLDCIKYCMDIIYRDQIEGDLLEAGVWKWGSAIYMKAIQKANNDSTRKLFAADSFEGCPTPSLKEDEKDNYVSFTFLQAGLDVVKNNFNNYNLLDEQVVFLKGWFKDTLPNAPVDQLALLRIDGDMYESTMDVLVNCFDKVSVGGFIILDDFGGIPASKKAVMDFRAKNNITDEIITVDYTGAYWRKS